jgi:transcriptional regulator with XRE-family HTH domain
MARYEWGTPGAVRAGRRIKARRREIGITRVQLAEAAGIAVSTLTRIENGYQAHPRLDLVGHALIALRAGASRRAAFRLETLVLRELAGLGG